ncbi:DDE-type integrase/transposase/recombinase [Streptomyces wuyuanensis]|uniref:DDE-type integrase/transposase/recombinase n=1 Tax=Streptomyces wuyuanensis TaxID=1196353 RepID=UPI003D745198
MTYVRTWSGWAYVALVLNVYSRMIVGWQVANHMRTELPLDALEMALWRRSIKKDSGPIHHSDRLSLSNTCPFGTPTGRGAAKADQAGERARFYGEVLAAEKKIVAGVMLAGGRRPGSTAPTVPRPAASTPPRTPGLPRRPAAHAPAGQGPG